MYGRHFNHMKKKIDPMCTRCGVKESKRKDKQGFETICQNKEDKDTGTYTWHNFSKDPAQAKFEDIGIISTRFSDIDKGNRKTEWNCEHGVGHDYGVHGCDGCCHKLPENFLKDLAEKHQKQFDSTLRTKADTQYKKAKSKANEVKLEKELIETMLHKDKAIKRKRDIALEKLDREQEVDYWNHEDWVKFEELENEYAKEKARNKKLKHILWSIVIVVIVGIIIKLSL
jgi:hypothetical protein